MKSIYKILGLSVLMGLVFSSCSDEFLDQKPIGQINPDILVNVEGANAVLIGAYSLLDGYTQGGLGGNGAYSGANWIWGDVRSDDMYRGDQTGGWDAINSIERYEMTSANTWARDSWAGWFDGVSRANDVLNILRIATDIPIEDANQIEAEARWLRAHYHFSARIIHEKIPYITEADDPITVANDREIWDDIEADIKWGIDNGMDEAPEEKGRISRWAAKAFLARVHLFQGEYAQAKPYLDDIINNGGFALMPHFYDNNNEEFQVNNNSETIFDIQHSVNDGAGKWNSSFAQQVGFPRVLGYCCDYLKPSFDLFNAFKVDASGVPLLDTYRDNLDIHDQNITFDQDFTPPSFLLDPRVDWTIGRRGVPYLDHGVHRGSSWSWRQDEMGPFLHKKIQFWKKNESWIKSSAWHWASGINGDNHNLYRLGHIMLWRAEVAVEENDLTTAMNLVNEIRARASDDILMGRVLTENFGGIADESEIQIDMNQPAANYLLGQYSSFPDQAYARKAVRHEIRLEFALEGMRFFDLVRWGIADQELNGYLQAEAATTANRVWMNGVTFSAAQDSYAPIPQQQIDLQPGVLTQNASNGGN
ncbi:MAG: RagB/SusD family nutrient uptake outer membrane protein [Cyclobacteriaceae bacterium]